MQKKRKWIVIVISISVLALAFALILWLFAPAIFQRGNPIPYYAAVSKLSDDTPYVQVEENDNAIIYISLEGTEVVDQFLKYVSEKTGMKYKDQYGSSYLFTDGKNTSYVTVEVFWHNYLVWKVPKEGNAGIVE